jgi:hypothetical protein
MNVTSRVMNVARTSDGKGLGMAFDDEMAQKIAEAFLDITNAVTEKIKDHMVEAAYNEKKFPDDLLPSLAHECAESLLILEVFSKRAESDPDINREHAAIGLGYYHAKALMMLFDMLGKSLIRARGVDDEDAGMRTVMMIAIAMTLQDAPDMAKVADVELEWRSVKAEEPPTNDGEENV